MPKTVAIIGAGPVGLAAACHALQRGLTPIVLEQGPEAGHAVRRWSHVRMFSPWAFNIDKAAAKMLQEADWSAPEPEDYPAGAEFIDHYLAPLATRTVLAETIRTGSKVIAVTRNGFDKVKTSGRELAPFLLTYERHGQHESIEAGAVIDASGAWFSPNPAGANGVPAIGETGNADRIAYGMPNVLGAGSADYAHKTVAVLGSGHSALGTLLNLSKLAASAPRTTILWLTRKDNIEDAFGGGVKDQLKERGALGLAFRELVTSGGVQVEPRFHLAAISASNGRLVLKGGAGCACRSIMADRLVVAAGFRPDLSFLRELRISLDPALECPPALAPLIDPNKHSCGTVRPHGVHELSHPEPEFYIAGMKSYGRAPNFLAITGYEQVRSIVAGLAGDHVAASRVEFVLPETGVCKAPAIRSIADSSCGDAASSVAGQNRVACCG